MNFAKFLRSPTFLRRPLVAASKANTIFSTKLSQDNRANGGSVKKH